MRWCLIRREQKVDFYHRNNRQPLARQNGQILQSTWLQIQKVSFFLRKQSLLILARKSTLLRSAAETIQTWSEML